MKVEILLSAYNGERFIEEQLKSLISQTIKPHIIVRDDGSSDSTEKIITSFDEIEYIKGENVGSTESFFLLIDHASECDYYAFCDQDDVWDDDKLEYAISMLKQYEDIPAIYSSNTRLVDVNLNHIKNENKKPRISLGASIIKNYATGCTVVFNDKLMKELKKYHPQNVPYHDWWVNLVCLSIGGVSVFDNNPHISYRQHGNNVVSGNDSFLKKWKSRIRKFNKPYYRDAMTRQLLDLYKDDISEEGKEVLQSVADYKTRKIRLIMDDRIQTGAVLTDLLFRVCVLFNRI